MPKGVYKRKLTTVRPARPKTDEPKYLVIWDDTVTDFETGKVITGFKSIFTDEKPSDLESITCFKLTKMKR